MFSNAEYEQYRDGSRALSGILAYSGEWTTTLGGEEPRRAQGALVTCNYFDVLELRPALGPGFGAANCEAADAPPAVILSHELWRSRFEEDRQIVGQTVLLNRESFTVVGVRGSRCRLALMPACMDNSTSRRPVSSVPITDSSCVRAPSAAQLLATLAAPPRRSSWFLKRTTGTGASGEMRETSPNQ